MTIRTGEDISKAVLEGLPGSEGPDADDAAMPLLLARVHHLVVRPAHLVAEQLVDALERGALADEPAGAERVSMTLALAIGAAYLAGAMWGQKLLEQALDAGPCPGHLGSGEQCTLIAGHDGPCSSEGD